MRSNNNRNVIKEIAAIAVTLYGEGSKGRNREAVTTRLSKKEHRADALALRADERRDKLRKAVGRSKYPEIHGYLNGGTHMERLHVSMPESIGYGREPGELKHLSSRRKRKKHRFRK